MNEELTLSIITGEMAIILLFSLVAFVLSMMLTPIYTYLAYRYKFWKVQRTTSTDGKELRVFNKLHAKKFNRNIPTMSGAISVFSIAAVTLVFNLDRGETWLPLAGLIGGGVVGLIDDIINIRGGGKGVAGLRSGLKFTMITIIGVALGWFFYTKLGYQTLHIPFVGGLHVGWLMVPLFAFAVVATGNAVNISDGLDGLAGGLLMAAFGAFGVISLFQGHFALAAFCFTVMGALLSYIWFNIYPARFFMGDVGSFAFGVALAVVAMMTNTFLLLPIIGLVFVLEAGSSLIQIVSKKFFKRRVFISAPVHHHLEAIGWPETKVTMRFWVIGWVVAFIGVYLALAGGHI